MISSNTEEREISHKNTIKCAWTSTSLRMAQSRDSRIEAESFRKDFLDILGTDGVEVQVMGTFSDDDDSLALAKLPVL
jgi:hypothetical protein